uniref:Uncharacterized protein n=1 Tax=Aegilops tauschii subsp. strangulata TaxID=200361 RepID=A0A453ILM5_AEGTS
MDLVFAHQQLVHVFIFSFIFFSFLAPFFFFLTGFDSVL